MPEADCGALKGQQSQSESSPVVSGRVKGCQYFLAGRAASALPVFLLPFSVLFSLATRLFPALFLFLSSPLLTFESSYFSDLPHLSLNENFHTSY